MLNRKCESSIAKLLGKGDFNVRITVVEKKLSRFIEKSCIDGPWRETFRDSIGGGIINDSTNTYLISCKTEERTIDFATKGSCIIDECWEFLQNVDAARINIVKYPTDKNKVKSWIVARE